MIHHWEPPELKLHDFVEVRSGRLCAEGTIVHLDDETVTIIDQDNQRRQVSRGACSWAPRPDQIAAELAKVRKR